MIPPNASLRQVPFTGEHRVRVTAIGLVAFACGAMNPLMLNLVGEIYLSELLLPLAALAALFIRNGGSALRERVFWLFVLAACVTLGGYVLSDFIRETRPDQYLRGWGRILLLIADFAALSILLGQDRRNLWWFALGMGVGGVLYLRLVLHTPISVWKFGYAEPMLLVAATLGCLLPIRVGAAWLALLGVASMRYDFRSFAAICFLLTAYMWVRAARPGQSLIGNGRILKAVLAGGLAGMMVLVALALTESEYASQRREQSNAGRGAAFEVGLIAIGRSPLLGYGSWTEDRELAEMYMARYLDKRGYRDPNADAGRRFAPHSQILQSWVEGGVLGAALFLVLGYQLIRSAKWAALVRPVDLLTPLILYLLFSCSWNLLMSPFSAPHRIQIALGAAILVLLAQEQRQGADPRRSRAPSQPPTIVASSRFGGAPTAPGNRVR
jgi:O-antigen ligase